MYTRRRHLSAAVALTAAAALALAGCSSDSPTPEAPPSSQTTTAGSSPLAMAQTLDGEEATTKDATPGRVTDTSRKVTPADQRAPAQLTVTEIRVGEHEGKDRVVFELGGTGTPSYMVDYVDSPAQQGSGHPLDVTGDSFLQVMLGGQALPTGERTEVPVGAVSADEVSNVTRVAFGGQFEGQAQAVVGLDGTDRAFTVFTLQDPTRVVVDIDR